MSSKLWQLLNRKFIYKAKTPDEISLVSDEILLPSGRKIDYIFVDCPYEVVYVLGLQKDQVLLIKQHRYIIDEEILEIPAGSPEKGESLEEGARREYLEETGYYAHSLTKLGEFYSSVGMTNQVNHIYLAQNLEEKEQSLEETELIKLHWVDFTKALDYVISNKIKNVGASYAILLLDKWKQKIDASHV